MKAQEVFVIKDRGGEYVACDQVESMDSADSCDWVRNVRLAKRFGTRRACYVWIHYFARKYEVRVVRLLPPVKPCCCRR